MDSKKTILIYQYSERIKSELIIAFKLLAKMATLDGEERKGAAKVMASFLEALLGEVRAAQNVEKSTYLLEAEEMIMEAIEKMQLSDPVKIHKCLSEALSSITTSCQNAKEALESMNLL